MQPNSQSGNILIYVLVGIVLFAAVMFAVSRGGGNAGSLGSKGNVKLQAQQILDYARSIETAVQKLLMKGCSENEISFENSEVSGYENPNSPAAGDKRCWVFHSAGGNVRWGKPPAQSNNGSDFIFPARNALRGSQSSVPGTVFSITGCALNTPACADLLMMGRFISLPVCTEINKQLKVQTPSGGIAQELDFISAVKFIGSFYYSGTVDPMDAGSYFVTPSSFCYKYGTNEYVFIHALLMR